MRIASAVWCFALAGFVGLHPSPVAAAEGTVTAVPLYRLWAWTPNYANFYTTRVPEKEAYQARGWKDSGPYCYISAQPFSGGVFFWRLWNPQTDDYYYTADPLSRDDYVERRGYMPQKAAGYVLPPGTPRAGTVPFYMGYDDYQQHHYYTTDKKAFEQGNYKYVMEVCRVWPSAAVVSEIVVTSPKPGEALTIGTTRTITWTTTSSDGGASLQLSTDGGSTWKLLTVKPVPNTGSLAWSVPAAVTDHARIKAFWVDKVVDTGVNWASSVTPGDFRIVNAGNPPPPPSPPPPDPGNPPPKALQLTAVASIGRTVHLSWTAGVPPNVTGYTVERKPQGGFFGVLRIVGKNVTQLQDAGVVPGATYRYRVRAWIGIEPSTVSNDVVVTPK